jgi:pilus assembly protein CpaE
VAATITVVESSDQQPLTTLARSAGVAVAATIPINDLSTADRQPRPPDLLILDLRGQNGLPAALSAVRRRHPRMQVLVVASQLEPNLMLEAMRAGVNDFVTEPVSAEDLRAGVERVIGRQAMPDASSQVLAFVGAKGGVGTTTLAVNVAAALAIQHPSQVLLVDMHLAAHGDVALFLGLEPRFSVADALENTNRLDQSYLKTLVVRTKGGLDVLASPQHPMLRPPEPQQMRALLERLATIYPYIVLDVPQSDVRLVDTLEPISAMTIVLNQELPTVRRAAEVSPLLRQRYGKDRVAAVVSRFDARAELSQDDIERVIGVPVWGALPSDYRKAVTAANTGKPLVTDNHSRLAASVIKLALRLVGETVDEPRPAAKAGGRLGFFSS